MVISVASTHVQYTHAYTPINVHVNTTHINGLLDTAALSKLSGKASKQSKVNYIRPNLVRLVEDRNYSRQRENSNHGNSAEWTCFPNKAIVHIEWLLVIHTVSI